MSKINPSEISHNLTSYFNKEEIDTLCFELGIDYRNFKGHFLSDRVLEMLNLIEDEHKHQELFQLIQRKRPHLFEQPAIENSSMVELDYLNPNTLLTMDRIALFRITISNFSYAQLQAICVDLSLDESALIGNTKIAKAREMIVALDENKQLPQLRKRLIDHFSHADPISPLEHTQPEQITPIQHFPKSIFDNLSFDDFQKVCRHVIGLQYNEIPDVNDKVTWLVDYVFRRNQPAKLVSILLRFAPDIPWQELALSHQANYIKPNTFLGKISFHFSVEELAILIFDLGLDEDEIVEPVHANSVKNLLEQCREANKENRLIDFLKKERQNVDWDL